MAAMYTRHFHLQHPPFSIAPDPRYLFMSERHREALAHLLYGIDAGGGVVLLTGEIGTGKTTLCRSLLQQIPDTCNIAYVFNPQLSADELLETICSEFSISLPEQQQDRGGTRVWTEALNRFLLAQYAAGRNSVLVIDEAQNLSPQVLEQLRLLTNLETNERKLLQIILIGQPELRTLLAQPALEQLAQRVIAHYHLNALNEQETASYVQHRLSTAGLTGPSPFQPNLIAHIHRLSGGVPRRINLLCDRALLGAYAQGKPDVNRVTLLRAASELFIHQRQTRSGVGFRKLGLATLAGAALSAGIALAINQAATDAPAPPLAAPVALTPDPDSMNKQDAALAEAQPDLTPVAIEIEEAPLPAPAEAEVTGISDEQEALRQLAYLWGWQDNQDPPCKEKQAKALLCYSSDGGLAALRQLDRPAVLRLYNEKGEPYYALLTALDENSARLQAGDARQDVKLTDLTRRFFGEFTTLWRAPEGFTGMVTLGQHGATVDWIGTQLARVHGAALPAPRQPFNLTLYEQVRRFQQAHGLKVDGVVGPVTFMHLNRAAGVVEPRLITTGIKD